MQSEGSESLRKGLQILPNVPKLLNVAELELQVGWFPLQQIEVSPDFRGARASELWAGDMSGEVKLWVPSLSYKQASAVPQNLNSHQDSIAAQPELHLPCVILCLCVKI